MAAGELDIDVILQRGLDLYGRQLVEEACECWRAVLSLSPGHPVALDYLEAAGASMRGVEPSLTGVLRLIEAPQEGEPPRSSLGDDTPDRIDEMVSDQDAQTSPIKRAIEHVRAWRLEEALEDLYSAHGENPHDLAVSRSIRAVKDRLIRDYGAELQDRRAVFQRTRASSTGLQGDELTTFVLVDGIIDIDDVLASSRLGPLRTLRALVGLLRGGFIQRSPSPGLRTEPPPRPVEPAEPTRRLELVTTGPPRIPLPSPSPVLESDEAVAVEASPDSPIPPPSPASGSNDLSGLVARAVRCWLHGDLAGARSILAECEAIGPDDPVLRRNLHQLRRRFGMDGTRGSE